MAAASAALPDLRRRAIARQDAGGGEFNDASAQAEVPLDATTVRLLPEHVDLSVVLTTAGLGALGATCIGAFLRFDTERLRRVALLGSVLGGTFGVAYWVLALLRAIP